MTAHGRVEWRSELRRIWLFIEGGPEAGAFETSELGIETSTGKPLLAVDRDGLHHLLLPVTDADSVLHDGVSDAVKVEGIRLVVSGVEHRYADVSCQRSDLFDLFDDVLAEILDEIGSGADPAMVPAAVLARWRDLLRARAHRPLGPEELAGLFGELTMLSELLEADPSLPIECWRGPLRAIHDFVLVTRVIEVKTTSAPTDYLVRVHDIDQLAAPRGLLLTLVFFRIALSQDGHSLPELARRVTNQLQHTDGFGVLLARAGYRAEDAHLYEDHRYVVTERRELPVSDGFPRLVRSSLTVGDLPAAISEVSYTVDLASAVHDPHGDVP